MSRTDIKRVVVLLAIVLSLGTAPICTAQSNPDVPDYLRDIVQRSNLNAPLSEHQLGSILPMVSDAIIKINGMDSSSKEAEYVRNLVLTRKAPEPVTAPREKAPLAHYRFQEGYDLPDQAVIQEQLNKAKLILANNNQINSGIREGAQEAIKSGPKTPEEPTKLISKPTCDVSTSAQLSIPKGFLAEGKPLDILFVDGKPPFDVKTVIGKNTVVVAFGDQDSAAMASPFSSLEIDCVPFRIRSTGSKVIYGKGADALKNYDANPDANGTLDPTAKKYIQLKNLKE